MTKIYNTTGIITLEPNRSGIIGVGASGLAAYDYRKTILIAHTDDGAQTDYQKRILVGESSGSGANDVHCEGHVLSNFNDIRFTTSDFITECKYWIESISGATPNQVAAVWVKIPAIAAHPNDTTICLYYGNAGASSNSNFDDTFVFGDDFSSATLNSTRWPSTEGGPTYTIDSTNHYLEVSTMATSTWGSATHGFKGKAITLPTQYIVEHAYGATTGIRLWMNNTASALGMIALRKEKSDNSGISYIAMNDPWASDTKFIPYVNVGASTYTGPTTNEAAYWYFKWRKEAGNIKGDDSSDGVSYTNRENVADANATDHFRINVYKYSGYTMTLCRIYAFKVRVYTANDPAWSTMGSEQSMKDRTILIGS